MLDKVELLKKIELYRASHPDTERLTDEQIISVMVEEKVITLSEAQKISVFGVQSGNSESDVDLGNTKTRTITLPSGRKIVIKDGITKYYAADGVELTKEYFEKQEGQVDVKPSGRYSVTKGGKIGYYAADGTELNAKYFKQVEGNDTKVTLSDGKTYNLNETLTSRINNVASDLKKAEDNNGFIGKGWSWFKNTTGIGDSSDKVREQQEAEKKLLAQFNSNEQKRPEIFKELTGVDYTPENLEKFIKGEIKLKSEQALSGYKEGQEMASDVAGDIVSGIAAVGIYTASVAAAPFTGGASIAVGVAAATASGALIKTGVKAADTIGTDREYTFDDFKHDAVTGGFSGAIAPVTGGLGGAAGKAAATRLGIQAIKQTGKAAAAQGTKSGIKTALLNPTGYEYIGGNVLKRGLAVSAEMATDGAVGGAVDNAFRTAYDGGSLEEVGTAAVEGFVGGAIMSPVIGGGMKGVGVAFNRIKGIDEFSSIVTNCKNLGDEDLLNLYQYYKNYERECIKNNKPVPDMKQAGFDKLMEEANSRFGNITPDNIDFARELLADKGCSRAWIADVLEYTTKDNIEAARDMIADKKFPRKEIVHILRYTTKDNIEAACDMVADKEFPRDLMLDVLSRTTKDNIEAARDMVADKEFPREWIVGVLNWTTKDNIEVARDMIADKEFPRNLMADALSRTTKDNIEVARDMVADKEFPRDLMLNVLSRTTKDNIEAARDMVANKEFPRDMIDVVLGCITEDNIDFVRERATDKEFTRDMIIGVLNWTTKDNIEVARDMIADKEFPRNLMADVLSRTTEDNIEVARDMVANKEFPRDMIADVLRYTTKDNIEAARDMIADKEFPRNWMLGVLNCTTKDNIDAARDMIADKEFPRNLMKDILSRTTKDNRDFAQELVANKDFPKDRIRRVLIHTNKDNINFARELVANKEFPREQIADVLSFTNTHNVGFARELFADKEFPREQIADVLAYTNTHNVGFARKLFADKEFPQNKRCKVICSYNKDSKPLLDLISSRKDIKNKNIVLIGIADCITCKYGVNRGKIDANKVKRYTALLENPKTSPFVVKKLNEGMDIDTAAFLLKTQQKLDGENTAKQQANKKSQVQNYSTDQQSLNEQFTALGLSENESKAIIKAISVNGEVNMELRNKAVELIQQGIAKNRIGDILTSAKITGQYNPKIVDDFVSLQGLGLNPLLEKNLAILNNISGKDVAEKFNSKVKKQMIGMLDNLPESKKILLEEQGFELNSILEKLNTQPIRLTQAAPQKVKVPEGMRMSKSKLTGFERIVVDKYNPDPKIWMSEVNTRKWAEDKYNDFKNGDYKSRTYPDANEGREKILNEWFEFLDTDPDVKDNPFVKIIISEYIVKDLAPENAWLPPAFDKALIKEVLNSAMDNNNVSIASTYAKKLKAKAEKSTIKEEVYVDGIKGTWYTVPQTDKSSPDFQTNADKVKAFSDGTNWCIRTYNAEPYVQQGAMHFFVDENGLTQVCVRETAPGQVHEIQKRQQNATRPIPYITVVKDFLDRHELKTPSGYLDDALNAKPKFDAQKKSFNEAAQRGDYKFILEQMGIKVEVLPDGTYAISHYSPTLGEYTINDLGIKENELLANVSVIRGDATFENSNATTLPNLREVGGQFTFDGSNIYDIRNLREINGYKIEWN